MLTNSIFNIKNTKFLLSFFIKEIFIKIALSFT